MTTLSIPLEDRLAKQVARESANAGKTPEEFARDVLRRVTNLSMLRSLSEKNAADLRKAGYKDEADVAAAIERGIQDVRDSKQ